ncbi:MAG: response regulator [Pyrinomonadaceae bacterium]|nr:response regulator [Pyrinomonadaceae bacterium]
MTQEGSRRGPLILIVEDYDDTRRMLALALGRNGYRVVQAGDGLSGLEAARRERPDLVLMDINMPVLDGLSATRRIRQTKGLEGVPVIAFSAYGEALMGEKARAAGCDAYIETPVGPDELVAKINRLLP